MTRHVWIRQSHDHSSPRQGFVLSWRRSSRLAGGGWEAQVAYADTGDVARVEWVPASLLVPVESGPGSVAGRA